MKRLIVCFLGVILVVMYANSVFAWTTHPFIFGWSDIHSSDKGHWKHWHIVSTPKHLRSYTLDQTVNQITFVRKNGQEKIHQFYSRESFFSQGKGEMYDLTMAHLREIADLIETQVDTEVVAVSVMTGIQEMIIFLDSKYELDEKTYGRLIDFLNKKRAEKIKNGTFVVNQKIRERLDNL